MKQLKASRFLVPGLLISAGLLRSMECADDVVQQFKDSREIISNTETARKDPASDIGKIRDEIYESLLPLMKLKLDQAMLNLDRDETYPTKRMKKTLADQISGARSFQSKSTETAAAQLRQIPKLLELMKLGRDPLMKLKGTRIERAYIAKNDGSAQPYYLYVPKAYNAQKKWPLFIFLHGWVPQTSKIDPWLCSERILEVAEAQNILFLEPHGRRNTDFQFVGEIDVLESIRQTQRFYSVDPKRVYLIGASMGGAGVWHLGVHYPHEFAGISPINGQVDWFGFWYDVFRYPARQLLPRHQQWLIALNNPMDLLGSLKALPTYVQNATQDHINNPRHIKKAIATLKEIGGPMKTFFDPADLGHFIYFETPVYLRAFETLGEYRLDPAPSSVQHHTYSLRFPRAYWVTIDRFEKWGPKTKIQADVKDGAIQVQTQNVLSYHLNLPRKFFKDGQTVKVVSNGVSVFNGKVPENRTVSVGPQEPAAGLIKSHKVCGPVADAFNFPFMVVRGTIGSSKQTRALEDKVDSFLTDWWAYAEGLPPSKKDSEVIDEDIKSRNLVLFGRPDTNSFLKRIAPKLPIQIGSDYFQVDGQKFTGPDIGLAMIYPNPLNPDRYVVVFSGYPWGEMRGSNHKYDLLPDFIIYNNQFDPAVKTNHSLCAGFFDTQWKLSDELTWKD